MRLLDFKSGGASAAPALIAMFDRIVAVVVNGWLASSQ